MTETFVTEIINTVYNASWRASFAPFCAKCWNGIDKAKVDFPVQGKFITNHRDENNPTRVYDDTGKIKFSINGSLYCFCRTDIWVFYVDGEEVKVDHGLSKMETIKSGNTVYVDMKNYEIIDTIINAQFVTWLNDNAVEMDPRGSQYMNFGVGTYFKWTKTPLYFRSFKKQVTKPKGIVDLEKENNTMKEELAATKSELDKLKQQMTVYADLAKQFEKIKGMMM